MADRCAYCGSANTQDQVYGWQCLVCGKLTDSYGEKVSDEVRLGGIDLNDPPDDHVDPDGSPAARPRTPDGVADPGTNIEGMSDADKKGLPEPPPKKVDQRPTSMQTEHSTVDPELERVDVEETHQDMQKVGGFGAEEGLAAQEQLRARAEAATKKSSKK